MRKSLIIILILILILAFLIMPIVLIESKTSSQYMSMQGVPPEVNIDPPSIIDHVEMLYSDEDIYVAAQMLHGEAGSDTITKENKEKVICVACNRLLNPEFDIYGDTLSKQIRYPKQFTGWNKSIVPTEYELKLAKSVLWRHSQILHGCEGIRWETDCYYFYGDDGQNHFY